MLLKQQRLNHVLRINLLAVLLLPLLCGCAGSGGEEVRFPGGEWDMFAAPEEAGWSAQGIADAKRIWEEIDSDAFLAVYDGVVLAAWGDVSRRYMCHSVRKSFLSALYGIHVAEGNIDLNKTLDELGIDDEPPLTEAEQRARIIHLLQSRSGVYHPAAYETPAMKEQRPQRGSKKPGEFWYYNNWDFNALCTIFERETGAGMFDEFKRRLADPLQMEDFRMMDAYYHLEARHSIHPAYPFRISARDMARFGLLFLRNGKWKDLEMIPAAWVEASRRAYSTVPNREEYGYGYMWWVIIDEADKKHGMYSALGYGGHMIAVLPREKMVFVNRADTYLGKSTSREDLHRLIDAILDARISAVRERPRLVPLLVQPKDAPAAGNISLPLDHYAGSFQFEDEQIFTGTIPYVIGDMIGRSITLEVDGRCLLMTDNLGQKFCLWPRSRNEFFVQDMEITVFFDMDERDRPVRITLDASPAWKVTGKRIEPPNQ
jgi:CubicO group peptidase (beta-lactamase class C family)